MRGINEVLRLKWSCGLSERSIAQSCSLARSTVAKYLRRAQDAGLHWPLPDNVTEDELERRLFPRHRVVHESPRFIPDWTEVHKELKRKDVTLQLVWEEYKQAHPHGLQYSHFCTRYRAWRGTLDLPMRQQHKAGEKMFVDFCGQTAPVTDRATGEIHEAQIFVAMLGASSYTYVEACWSQGLPEWITAHVHAFQYFGGSSTLVVPDNLKAGVSVANRYEPEINRTYEEWARYYDCAVVPARVHRPKDKAKAEKGIQDVERRILAAVRHRTFFSLTELNEALSWLLIQHNERPFQKLPGSRRSLFEQLDKPALRPLPQQPYEYAEWKKARVNIDYHVEVDGHYYSVPYQLVKEQVEVRMTSTTIEVLFKHRRVASHQRSPQKGRHTTLDEHMPKSHRAYLEWSPSRIIRWAGQTGPNTEALVTRIMETKKHPEQGFRACLGIIRLARRFSPNRLEAACARALQLGACNYKSVESILKSGFDRENPLLDPIPPKPPLQHANIRGKIYYN